MSSPATDRGFDRFVFFSDAVVAIAISLLILPVVDIAVDSTQDASDMLADNTYQIFAFVLSFGVIARFWVGHHRLFGRISHTTPLLMWLNLAWLLTIVFLPLPTELLGVRGDDETIVRVLYIGTVFLCSLLLAVLARIIDVSTDLGRDDTVPVAPAAAAFVTPSLVLAALVVSLVVAPLGMWPMLLLLLTGPITSRLPRARPVAP